MATAFLMGGGGRVNRWGIFRVVRLARVLRLVRLFTYSRHGMMYIKGIVTAFRALSWFIFFFLLCVYISAVLTVGLTRDDFADPPDLGAAEFFGTLRGAMMTFIQIPPLENWPDILWQ